MAWPKEFIVPWSGKGMNYTQGEINVVIKAMKEADPLTQGPHQAEFEKKFAAFFNVKHAFAVSSCTAALELSAILTKVKKGDEVIIPAHTFAATAIPFGRTGARIVWADIDPKTRLVTAETIKKCITSKTKVIVVVHLYGLVADMGPILALAKKHDLFVVEDAAQAPGAKYKGKRAGTLGDFGCFSFHTHKNISTLGEGGMLVVKDNALAQVVPGFRHNGMRGFDFKREKYWLPAMGNVDFDWDKVWPYNFCIGEVQCALGSKLLERLDRVNAQRRKRALGIISRLKDYPELEFQSIPKGCEHVFHLLAARYDGTAWGKTRDEFIELMAFKHKVKVIVQYYPLYRYPMFIKAGFGRANCPNTDQFFDNMVSFPFQHWMTASQVDHMVKAIIKTLDQLRRSK
jgi:dTDP-4-amino-4,6-dideoxygalactose transaminase